MFRALPCFIQLWKPNMVERCARRSLTTMHYFTRIYSASLLSVKQARARSLNICTAFSFLTLNGRVNTERMYKDRELPHPCGTVESIASVSLFFFLRGGDFVLFFLIFHSALVKMHEHHNPGTVTHWPTSTKKNVFFCLDKHTEEEFLKKRERGDSVKQKKEKRNKNYWFM